ncbi:hypothetical protein BGZ88_005854 [Linnemannia elongata]|nr:hypothetical protein BGZ88_005854 [Linnemannia elongata]
MNPPGGPHHPRRDHRQHTQTQAQTQPHQQQQQQQQTQLAPHDPQRQQRQPGHQAQAQPHLQTYATGRWHAQATPTQIAPSPTPSLARGHGSNGRHVNEPYHANTQAYGGHIESQELTDEEMSSIGTTQALEEGLSVATSKFNTERFGALSVHPNSGSATNLGTATGSGTDHYRNMHPSSLQDDDFGTHGNFDDNFDDLDFAGLDEDFEADDIAMDAEQDHPQLTASRTAAVETRSRRTIVEENSQDSSESEALKEKLAELEELLRVKDAELQSKSGEVTILRSNLDVRRKELMKAEDDLRMAQERHRAELVAAEEKLHTELEKTEVEHHFAVSKMIMDGQRSAKAQTQPVTRQQGPSFPFSSMSSTPSIPSTPFAFNSSQLSMKAKSKSDGAFSLDNFKPSQSAMSKSRSLGAKASSFDKPKLVPLLTTENGRATRPVFGFNSDIPTQSPEEVIRDSLFAVREFDFGLPQLRTIDPDEEHHAPLKDKPQHALNALKVLRILMMTYEDVSVEVSKGSVPFMEHDNEDAWKIAPSETSLPSALACVEYLLLTRLARNPPVKEAIGGIAYELKEEVENLFQLEIIQVLNFVAWSQLEAMQLARTFVPLIRKGVFEEVIRLQAAKNNLQKVRLMLNIMDFVSREVECCKLLMGWRVSQLAWSTNFRFMNTLIGLLGAKAESMEKLANGTVPRIKITIMDIIHRCLCVNLEQTKRMLVETKLMTTLVHSIRDLEELAASIHYQNTLVSLFRCKGSEGGFTTNFRVNRSYPLLLKPLLMTSMGLGSLSRPLKVTGTEKGVSPLSSVPLNSYDKLFDYLAVMKLGMEMILNLLRAFPDDIKRYFSRRPSEKHSLAFAVSKIVARELGLAEAVRNLAHDILYELVPDDETEQEYLDLVRD